MEQPSTSGAGGASRVRDPRDLQAGLLFVAIGLATVVLARRHPFGTGAAMGPGYFPTVLGGILLALGAIIALRSLRPGVTAEPLEPARFRPLVVIIASVVLFGALLPRLGLVVASLVVVAASRTAAPSFRWGEIALLGAVLTLFCTAVFVWGLAMPMPVWPPWVRG